MSTFSYIDKVYSPDSLSQSLVAHGIFDAQILIQDEYDEDEQPTGNEVIIIDTATGTEPSCDAAVLAAKVGGLIGNKSARIDQVEALTSDLASAGVSFSRPSDAAAGKGPLAVDYDTRANLRNLKQDVAEGLIVLPQMFDTVDGRGVEFFTQADINAAYVAVIDRGQYLLNDGLNGDGSYGQASLIKQIVQAADQTALDAIVDTRV